MLGLIILAFFIVYLMVSVFVTKKAVSWAKANGKRPWLWGGLAAFVMYNLVFWDWIPTLVMHKYYCSTQAGFTVYKTPEQWIEENPELSKEDLKPFSKMLNDMPHEVLNAGTPDAISVTKINQYIFKAFKREKGYGVLPRKNELYFYDNKSNEKLAGLVDFSSGYGNPMTTGKGLSAWKFWLGGGCYNPQIDVKKVTGFNKYLEQIMVIGESND